MNDQTMDSSSHEPQAPTAPRRMRDSRTDRSRSGFSSIALRVKRRCQTLAINRQDSAELGWVALERRESRGAKQTVLVEESLPERVKVVYPTTLHGDTRPQGQFAACYTPAIRLCKYCATIPGNFFSNASNDQSHKHHPSFRALQQSAKEEGCLLCKLFLHSVILRERKYGDQVSFDKAVDCMNLCSTKFDGQNITFAWKHAGSFRGLPVMDEWLDFEVPPPLAASEEQLQHQARLLLRWSQQCLDHHERCHQNVGFMPTRLVEVGTREKPSLRLVETDRTSEDSRYIALSHCWGLTMPASAKLTSSNLEQARQAIEYGDLPLTFQDAVQIARRTGIRFVWIDSLCIIQDSREDWEKEAAQMASVYGNAWLTLSASGSANGAGGCRTDHESQPYGPVDIQARVSEDAPGFSQELQGRTLKFRLWAQDPGSTNLTEDPLMQRGWCLQERELSPRIAHFSKDTLRWECRDLKASLRFPWGDNPSFNGEQRLLDTYESRFSMGRPTGTLQVEESRKAITKFRLCWMDIVTRYTQRSLTFRSDILPAFAGIARKCSEIYGDEYVAGLWKANIANELLWACKWNRNKTSRAHSRPTRVYLAPTWSWASVQGPIEYLSWVNGYWYTFNPDPDPKYLPTLTDTSLVPKSADPYGMLEAGGNISLRGHVAAAFTKNQVYSVSEESHIGQFHDRQDLFNPVDKTRVGFVRYDIPLCADCAPPGGVNAVLLLCCMKDKGHSDSPKTYALVLQLVSNADDGLPGTCQRVGVAWGIAAPYWEQSGQVMTIKLC